MPEDNAASGRIIDLLASSARVARLRRPDQSTMVLQSLGLQIAPDEASGLCRVCGLQEGKPAYESHQILIEDVLLEVNGVAVMHLTFDRIMMTLAKAGTEVVIKVATDWDVRRAQDLHNASPTMLLKPKPVRPPEQKMYAGSFWGDDEPEMLGASLNSSFGKSAPFLPKRAGTLDTSADVGEDDIFNISGIMPLDKSTVDDGAGTAGSGSGANARTLEPILSIPDMHRAAGVADANGDDAAPPAAAAGVRGDDDAVTGGSSGAMSPVLKDLGGIRLRGDAERSANALNLTSPPNNDSQMLATLVQSPIGAVASPLSGEAGNAATPDRNSNGGGGARAASSPGDAGAGAGGVVAPSSESAGATAPVTATVEPAPDYGFYVKLPPKRKKANKKKMSPQDAAVYAKKEAKAAELSDPSINLELESGDLNATRKLTRDFLSMGGGATSRSGPPSGLRAASAPASQTSSTRPTRSRAASVTGIASSAGDADAGSDGDSLVSSTLSSTAPSGLRGSLGELPSRGRPAGLFSASRPAGLRSPVDDDAHARRQAQKGALQQKVLAASASQESFGSGGSAINDVADFLRANKLGEYITIFEQEDIDFETLMEINETDLEKIGVTKLGARRKIMRAVVQLEPSDSISRARSSMAGSDTSSVRSHPSPVMGRRWRSAFQPIDHHVPRSGSQPDGIYRLATSQGLLGGGSVSSVSGSEASSRM